MPKRARIGDVVEISTKRGFAYGHYVLRHEQMGALLRVFPGFFSERPTDFTELVSRHRGSSRSFRLEQLFIAAFSP